MVQPVLVEELAGQCSNFVQQCIRLMDSGVTEDLGGLMVVTDGLEGKKDLLRGCSVQSGRMW